MTARVPAAGGRRRSPSCGERRRTTPAGAAPPAAETATSPRCCILTSQSAVAGSCGARRSFAAEFRAGWRAGCSCCSVSIAKLVGFKKF